ncbi:MAG TPA: alkaline phosphatase D family protein, partial [Xanthobacteraceae bacterium]
MAVSLGAGASLTRRRLLTSAAASAAAAAVDGLAKPAFSRAAERPIITHGIQSGDVSVDSAVVWARADRPSRMLVEVATSDSFTAIRHAVAVDALPETDFTAKALIEGLPAGQDIFYRIRFQDHAVPTVLGAPQVGRFRTAPSGRRSISFVWSGDTAGQGWGIDEARGGMRTYAAMLKCRPDFFIHSGDHIYADCPIRAEQKLPNGAVWKNVVTEDKSKIAQTLAEFRGNYKYNLLDRNVLAFNAEVPLFALWDDHEVTNDWCPGEALGWGGYVDKSVLKLAARGCRAFHEFMPMRETLAEAGRIYRKIAYG